ncbi:Retrovirus-related Pol polyprotein [Penaeus vannamei]|uniref:RNA-directed DNA polymerase n=1 Tax=Penaeus vannamei TaxID=6689 RepID=A0A423SNN2_PENVA|nr:Retrovirus-related Pol polyprotein [Penaeus vannamei]
MNLTPVPLEIRGGVPVLNFEFTDLPIREFDLPTPSPVSGSHSPPQRKALENEVQGMLDMNLIKRSNSPWASPMILVPKKDGSFRPVVDYRKLNAVTIPEPFPIPNLRLLLQDIGSGNLVFSTLDLAKGFLQVPVAKESRPLTAFSTHMGHFEFLRTPFGLRNSPLTFSRLMSIVLSEDVPFVWAKETEDSFLQLKALLANAPVLAFPDFELPFVLTTDASSVGLGATLHQKVNGKLRPIAFASRTLKPAERSDPHGRRARAIEVLAEYDVTIVYLPGRQNVVADALSRAPLPSPAELQACKSTPFPPSFAKRHEARTTAPVLANVANQPVDPPSEEEIRRAQREDPVYMDIIGKLERGEPLVPVRRLPVRQFYLADSGLLFRRATPKKIKGRRGLVRDVVVIPESLEPRVLQLVHESREAAHCGVYKAIQMARQRFFFPLLITKVKKHVKSCKVCPYFKGSTNQPAPALRYDVPDFPFEKVSCDTLSGFVTTRSGNKHILVFVDNFTRSLVDTSDNWDDLLLTIQSAINSTFHSSLGDTPHFLLYGSDKRLPYDLFQTRRKPEYSDSVGALVFRKVHTSDSMRPKLAPRFDGPYRVLEMLVLMLLAMASPLLAEPGLPERISTSSLNKLPPISSIPYSPSQIAFLSILPLNPSSRFQYRTNISSISSLPFDDISVLYFFQPSTATVTCKEALPDVVVTGIYVLPISCEIVTTSLFIPASHSYATDISVRGLNISPMPFHLSFPYSYSLVLSLYIPISHPTPPLAPLFLHARARHGCARFRSTYHHSDTCQKSRASQPVNPDAPTPGRHLATAAA